MEEGEGRGAGGECELETTPSGRGGREGGQGASVNWRQLPVEEGGGKGGRGRV